MELSGTESGDLYDKDQEQNIIKVEDCIAPTNVYILWALEYDKHNNISGFKWSY